MNNETENTAPATEAAAPAQAQQPAQGGRDFRGPRGPRRDGQNGRGPRGPRRDMQAKLRDNFYITGP